MKTKPVPLSRKNLSARHAYRMAYRRFRQHGEDYDFLWMSDSPNAIIQAAEYAYEAKTHRVSGWINRRRHTQFLNKKAMWRAGKLPPIQIDIDRW